VRYSKKDEFEIGINTGAHSSGTYESQDTKKNIASIESPQLGKFISN